MKATRLNAIHTLYHVQGGKPTPIMDSTFNNCSAKRYALRKEPQFKNGILIIIEKK